MPSLSLHPDGCRQPSVFRIILILCPQSYLSPLPGISCADSADLTLLSNSGKEFNVLLLVLIIVLLLFVGGGAFVLEGVLRLILIALLIMIILGAVFGRGRFR
jgi:hypothetical protein